MRSVLSEEHHIMDEPRLPDNTVTNANGEWDTNTLRRPELRKHKTLKTIEQLVADQKAIENRVPNRPLHAEFPQTTRTQSRNPAPSSASSTKAFQLLRDYEMATSILESRNRADYARRRPHVQFERQKIRMEDTFRSAPGGSKLVLDSSSSGSPGDGTVGRVLRAASADVLSKNIPSPSSGNDSSSSHDNNSGSSSNKKKKTVSFQDETSPSSSDARPSISSNNRRQHHMDHARCHDDENGQGNGHVASPIHAACYKGDHHLVTHVLSFYCGQDAFKLVNSQCSCGMTPLQVACDQGHVKVVKVLLRRQARVNKQRAGSSPVSSPAGFTSFGIGKKRHRSCIALACASRNAELVEMLLDHGANADEDALITACSVGDIPIVRLLMQSQKKSLGAQAVGGITGGLEKLWNGGSKNSSDTSFSAALASSGRSTGFSFPTTGSDVSGGIEATWISNAAAIAVANGHPHALAVLLGDDQSSTSRDRVVSCALEAATVADYKLLRCLTKLFDHALLISATDAHANTLLHLAVKQASTKCATLLLRLGVDVNARDALGITPLYMACARGQNAIAKLLVNAGAKCKRMGPNDETPLHIAAQENHLHCVQILLYDAHAPVDVTTLDKCTALHLACQRGNTQVAECLLDHGADVNARTVCDETPLLKASRMNNMETVKLLLSRDAEVATSSTSSISSCVVAEYTHTASTSSSVFSTNHSTGNSSLVDGEESRRHQQQQRQPKRRSGEASARSSGHADSKSNAHTSLKGWFKSVVGKK